MLDVKLTIGDAYAPSSFDDRVVAQVGLGKDVGFFRNEGSRDEFQPGSFLFRVPVVVQSFKRDWKRIGNFPLAQPLDSFGRYFETEIGTGRLFVTSLENADERTLVSRCEIAGLERLQFFATPHLVSRLEALGLQSI